MKNFEPLLKICQQDIKFNTVGIRILGIHDMDNGSQWKVTRHRHTFFELHYVIKGHVHTRMEEQEYKIEAGTYYIIAPQTYHSHKQKEGSSHIGVAIRWEFTNETIETKELASALEQASLEPIAEDANMHAYIASLLKTGEENKSMSEVQLLVLQIVFRAAAQQQREDAMDYSMYKKRQHDHIVNQALRFIEENYMQDILVEDVAHSVYMSYSQLSRLFKRYVGTSVNQYINAYRIERAKVLLKTTPYEIRRIAEVTGFNSEYYFCNAFKNHMGIAPSRYRKL